MVGEVARVRRMVETKLERKNGEMNPGNGKEMTGH